MSVDLQLSNIRLALAEGDKALAEALMAQAMRTDPPPPDVLEFVADCLSPDGRSEWRVTLQRRKRGRPRKAYSHDNAMYLASLADPESGHSYEAAIAAFCEATGVKRTAATELLRAVRAIEALDEIE